MLSRRKNLQKLLLQHFRDERLTTVMAQRQLIEADVSRKKRKKVIDKMAAVVILEGYLQHLSFKNRG